MSRCELVFRLSFPVLVLYSTFVSGLFSSAHR
jgi:hypothetical protein